MPGESPYLLRLHGVFLIGITGIGICIGTICRNMLQAILLSFVVWFAGIFPAGITPVTNMKPFLQKIAQGVPTTHFNIAANGIMQKGLGFAVLWPEAVKVVAYRLGIYDHWLFSRLETVQAVNAKWRKGEAILLPDT